MGTAVTRTAGWWALAAIVVTAATLLAGSAPRGTRHGAGDLVWVTKRNTGTVAVIDPTTNQVIGEVKPSVSAIMQSVAVGAGAVWAVLPEDALVVRIDPATDQVTARIRIAGFPSAVAVG